MTRTLDAIVAALERLAPLTPDGLLEERYRKYRRLGEWQTEGLAPIGSVH